MKFPITLLFLLAAVVALASAATEPKTGISFPDSYKGSNLESLGVRTKGPIKVYGVGKYDHTFVLKMSMGVGSAKMTNALADALKPRGCDQDTIEEFSSVLLGGLPKSGASKGTSLAFGTDGGKLSIAVNDKHVGTIPSKPLAKAFAGIYTDGKAVCKLCPVEKE
uniref:Chalcone isomerase domain-containing protein n=1 Tax=Grammatophora oceanica TaxID=210454 RepID=A0A7S1UL69_9STRA|mmetsp:Transcript_10727/g.15628  ORF Transcript_10727/g.15628 Transcript_10727/m.15628 type:complete len:165 (+) Transcript_10727:65-559(+)